MSISENSRVFQFLFWCFCHLDISLLYSALCFTVLHQKTIKFSIIPFIMETTAMEMRQGLNFIRNSAWDCVSRRVGINLFYYSPMMGNWITSEKLWNNSKKQRNFQECLWHLMCWNSGTIFFLGKQWAWGTQNVLFTFSPKFSIGRKAQESKTFDANISKINMYHQTMSPLALSMPFVLIINAYHQVMLLVCTILTH